VGVPLLYLHITSPTLEAPSPTTLANAEDKTKQICSIRPQDKEVLTALKGGEEDVAPRRGKKRPRGPNPLSCKKRKKSEGEKSEGNEKSKKKKKKKKKSVLEKKVRKEILGES